MGGGTQGKRRLGADQGIVRRWKHKHPTAYLAVAGTAQAIGGDERIEPARRPFEYMLNALRLVEGFPLERFEARTGLPRTANAAPLAQEQANGWLELAGEPGRRRAMGRATGTGERKTG